ncbi:SDR family NAD(P)-dependent oxidoreductase [Dyadobacter arcticus]|uniref:Short-subunit dehydrogenase n=1 Tax=Dyadobacter arcticus TaxID=1078754 RepID=A0ABX0UPM2_9BACT|nr:SDR family oxidoreductase [Dyadobacter arcticus]NIJ54373.1 short-subunit dehydrogenase [Dyadobacter arcticus]
MKKNNLDLFSGVSSRGVWMAAAGIGLAALAKIVYTKMTRYDFRDKVVLITGGSRGLGLEMARVLATKGSKIAICARTENQLEKAEFDPELEGAEILAIRADLTNASEANKVVQEVISHFGRLDVLINNAGIMVVGPENVMEIEDYQHVMDANLWSALYTMKAAIPHFLIQGEGRIANICSIGGKIAVPHMLPYSVSKFAMVGLSEGMGAELKKDNIQVTTVIPNLMRTGSPRNVSVKGNHESEYEWFKLADSLPFLAQDSKTAAKEIIEAIEDGENEVVLTATGKIVTALKGIMPGSVTTLTQFADRFFPRSNNKELKKGSESETEATTGLVGSVTDRAAAANNEL